MDGLHNHNQSGSRDSQERGADYDSFSSYYGLHGGLGYTGVGEIGVTLTPSQKLPLSIDLSGQGYVGKARA